jgi:hypothetical protein
MDAPTCLFFWSCAPHPAVLPTTSWCSAAEACQPRSISMLGPRVSTDIPGPVNAVPRLVSPEYPSLVTEAIQPKL